MDKTRIREYVWKILEEKGVAQYPLPLRGRIPNFKGADIAAQRLAGLEEWRRAEVVKINPDAPQKPVRVRALLERKIVIVPTPRIRSGFVILDPSIIPRRSISFASTIRGFMSLGKRVEKIEELKSIVKHIDLIVEGSVAVDLRGNRLGKGEGYGEIEYAMLREMNIVDENTPIATTVHDLQIVKKIPTDPWDVPVDIIVTPTRVYRVRLEKKRPIGILWDLMPREKIEEIPMLKQLCCIKGLCRCWQRGYNMMMRY